MLPNNFYLIILIRNVVEDLEVMLKENQVLSGRLVTSDSDRERAHKEVRELHSKLANAEQTERMKDTGLEDIRGAYEVLFMMYVVLEEYDTSSHSIWCCVL